MGRKGLKISTLLYRCQALSRGPAEPVTNLSALWSSVPGSLLCYNTFPSASPLRYKSSHAWHCLAQVRSEVCAHTVSSSRTTSLLLVLGVVGTTVILIALKKMSLEKKDRITLQDPEAKYPLPLIEKEVLGHPNFPIYMKEEDRECENASWEVGVSSHLGAKWSVFLRIWVTQQDS